ncbi:MAG: hypothetical protein V4617_12665 [Gemmatimonadota bacterium]
MSESNSSYKHDASDKKLDHAANDANDAARKAATQHGEQGHDEGKIARHDDTGKDRLFEGREQHDDAEMNSEKTRLAKDVSRHHHADQDAPADA